MYYGNNNGNFNNGNNGGNGNRPYYGDGTGYYGNQQQQMQRQQQRVTVPTFQTEDNKERDRTYREILKVLFSEHLNASKNNTSSFTGNRNINTTSDVARYILKCDDLSLTVEMSLDLRYRSLSFYVYPSEFNKRGEFIEVVNQEFFRKNPTLAAMMGSFARKLANVDPTYNVLNADGPAVAEDLFITMMEDVSSFVNNLSNWIVENVQVRNGQVFFNNPLMSTVLRRGFQVGGFTIMPVFSINPQTRQPMLTFNYTLDEVMTNSLKQDQQYFNEEDEDK